MLPTNCLIPERKIIALSHSSINWCVAHVVLDEVCLHWLMAVCVRVIDGVPATIDALSSIIRAANGTGLEVYLDGGVRSGLDVFIALALGKIGSVTA